ncbi:hypothetical protein AQUCO_04900081v1 [Aquilegia coerulea]|uniref:F-box domain-containing protein n=1 Tax=Aquilegia coerulea TaxID=218851 RepID=A0A2G5CJN5_AQUCA|nr:hypothetical protein AQUCO_04900081v1 [Aquilegia coerulea]
MENHMMQNLIIPSDLMEEILSRLPVKSLLRFRCVSKSWFMLINSTFFVHKHVNNQKNNKNNLRLMLPSKNVIILDCERFDDDEIQIKYPLLHKPKVWGSCNGLLCVINDENTICIWNPATRKCNILPNTCLEDLPKNWYTVYGFGYSEIVRDYEVIEIISFDEKTQNQHVDVRIRPSEVAIYSLRSKLWRRIQDIPYKIRNKMGVLVNGALHWQATQSSAGSLYSCELVIAFDIAGEKFREVPQPCFQKENLQGVNVAMLEGKLCAVYDYGYKPNVELWVMNNYGARESWIKLYKIKEK